MKKIFVLLFALVAIVTMGDGCTDADVASYNISKDADNFKVERRIVFYNGITGDYMLSIEGRCSLGNNDTPKQLSVTCKTGEDSYKKHFLGLSDNVTYFVEQVEGVNVSTYNYKVVFKPSIIIPDVELHLK